MVAAKGALRFPADGYTLYLTGNGAAISESLFTSLPFNITHDFASVSPLAQFDMLLATKGYPVRHGRKVRRLCQANPGKLNFGTIAAGSTQNLSAEMFNMITGVKVAIVTFRTTPEFDDRDPSRGHQRRFRLLRGAPSYGHQQAD